MGGQGVYRVSWAWRDADMLSVAMTNCQSVTAFLPALTVSGCIEVLALVLHIPQLRAWHDRWKHTIMVRQVIYDTSSEPPDLSAGARRMRAADGLYEWEKLDEH